MGSGSTGGKGRRHAALPKMFQRGVKGLFYFRRRLNGKDAWVGLGTSDPDEAKRELLRIVDSHVSVKALNKVEHSAQKLAEVFV